MCIRAVFLVQYLNMELYIFESLFIFFLGLCLGSFLNVVVYRLEKKESFIRGRSYCPHCKHGLMWLDLIPVISFLVLRGACRYCKKKISWQYPCIELLTGLLFVAAYMHAGDSAFFFAFLLYIICSMVVIFAYDLKHYIIADAVLLPAISVTFFYQLLAHPALFFTNYLWAGLCSFLFFYAIFFFSKEKWMGFGDCKFAIFMGFSLGYPQVFIAFLVAFWLGALVGLTLMAIQKKGLKSELPFAPFLVAGTILALFWGPQIMSWYAKLFLF